MFSRSKTRWAALSAIGLLAVGSAGCSYDDYRDHRGGWSRHDRGPGADRDHRRDRDDRNSPRRDRDRDRDHREGRPGPRGH